MLHELQAYSVSFPAQHPHVAPLSRLYSLEPIGISTPYAESLTGYIARLAQEHALSTRNLIVHFIIPVCSRFLPIQRWKRLLKRVFIMERQVHLRLNIDI